MSPFPYNLFVYNDAIVLGYIPMYHHDTYITMIPISPSHLYHHHTYITITPISPSYLYYTIIRISSASCVLTDTPIRGCIFTIHIILISLYLDIWYPDIIVLRCMVPGYHFCTVCYISYFCLFIINLLISLSLYFLSPSHVSPSISLSLSLFSLYCWHD